MEAGTGGSVDQTADQNCNGDEQVKNQYSERGARPLNVGFFEKLVLIASPKPEGTLRAQKDHIEITAARKLYDNYQLSSC